VRLLEQPAPICGGAGERAARVSEELGFQQRLGQRATILGDEGLAAARSVVVDEPREELLARSRLSRQQHRRLAVEHLGREVRHRAQAAVRPDQGVEAERARARRGQITADGVVGDLQLVAQARILAAQRVALGGAPHDHDQIVRLPRLRHEVVDPTCIDRLHEAVDVRVRGEDDADGLQRLLLAAAKELDAGHTGHSIVGDDDRDVLGPQDVQRHLAAAGAHDAEVRGEDRLQRVEDPRLVVDNQDGRAIHGTARVRRHAGPGSAATGAFLPRIS
jgi:hypothetical protein